MMMGALACLSLTGCRDQDFDWEAAKLVNPEYAYKVNFEKEFGVIDPNQSWDFTSFVNNTRGTTEFSTWPSAPNGLYNWKGDYTIVDQQLVEELGDILIEGSKNKDRNGNHYSNLGLGVSFSCSVPDNPFSITPIFQGGNDCDDVEVHMVVEYQGTQKDYKIWEKGDGLQKCVTYEDETTCSTCNGNGTILDTSAEALGTWNDELYKIQSNKGSRYLSGNDISSNSSYFAIIKENSGNSHLYSLSNHEYLKIDGTSLTTTKNISEASILNYTDRGELKLDNSYINIAESRWWSTTYTLSLGNSSNTNWTWSKANKGQVTDAIKNEIRALLYPTIACPICNGEGHSAHEHEWHDVKNYYNNRGTCKGTTSTETYVKQDANGVNRNFSVLAHGVRAQTLTLNVPGVNELPVGATIYFYSTAKDGGTYTHTSLSGNGVRTEILKLEQIHRPTTGVGSNTDHEIWIMSCEAGSDHDLNDVVFLIEGWDKAPKPRTEDPGTISEKSEITKRYMVEDLGATEASDIDFNDLVVDLKQTTTHYYDVTIVNGKTDLSTKTFRETVVSQTATVYALGGTKDLSLYVGDITGEHSLVFKKSTAGQDAQSEGSKIEFHTTYGGATEANPFSNVEKTVMYNTHYSSKNGDGKYDTNDYLFEVDLGEDEECLWNPSSNNIYVVVEESSSGVQVVPNSSNQTIITFPANGTVPTMIAVPTDQAWNYERVSVFTHDREGSKLQLQNYVQQTPTTEGN